MGENKDIDHYLKSDGVDSEREKMIGQTIGYRYDVNLLPDLSRLTPFLKKYLDYELQWDLIKGLKETLGA